MAKITDSIKDLKGVGPAKAAAYEKLGILKKQDLLYHFPRSYENRGDVRLLCDAPEDARCSVILTVGTEPKSVRVRGRMSLLKFRAFDESGSCEITFFNQEYLKNRFLLGSAFRFWGKVKRVGKRYTMLSPESEPYDIDTPLPDLMPVYRMSEGLTPKLIAQNVQEVLAAAALQEDHLPEDIVGREEVLHMCTDLLKALCRYQSEEGRWYQVVNKGDQEGNWLENSCSCLYVAALCKAMRLGYMGEEYADAARRGYEAVINSLEWKGEDLQIGNVCIGTGVGDYAFYCARPTSVNDLHGAGAFLLMCTEMQKWLDSRK
jgi:hypothetical protein